jgi:hypothetical protein
MYFGDNSREECVIDRRRLCEGIGLRRRARPPAAFEVRHVELEDVMHPFEDLELDRMGDPPALLAIRIADLAAMVPRLVRFAREPPR